MGNLRLGSERMIQSQVVQSTSGLHHIIEALAQVAKDAVDDPKVFTPPMRCWEIAALSRVVQGSGHGLWAS